MSMSRWDAEDRAGLSGGPIVLATDLDTNGSFAIVALTLPPFSPGAPLHSHLQHAEGCYVLAGTLAATQADRTIMIAAGAAVLVPPGVAHTCWNPTAAPTMVLLIYTPGGGEEELLALARGAPGLSIRRPDQA
jgi:mannose-6-phosphate isomerase-like protein (cupin superfamily)